MKIVYNKNYIDAAKSDYKKIKLQAKDLGSASKELHAEKLVLEQEIRTLMAKKQSIEELIENKLKPEVSILKEKLSAYKDAVERQKEVDILKKLSDKKTADMIENSVDDESQIKFAVKEHIDYSFINELNNDIRLFLDSIYYTRELKKHGVGVIFMNDNINTLDGDAELRLAIMSSIAQEESRKTSERVKWGQKRQMEQGVVFGRSISEFTSYEVELYGCKSIKKSRSL